MLLFAKPEDHPRINKALKDLLEVPFSFETTGSQIIFYQPDELINRRYPAAFRFRGDAEPSGEFQTEQEAGLPLRNR